MCTKDTGEIVYPAFPTLQSSAGTLFFDLPDDVVLLICAFLPIREIGRMAVVCKQMNDIVSERNLWKALVARDISLYIPDNVTEVKV